MISVVEVSDFYWKGNAFALQWHKSAFKRIL